MVSLGSDMQTTHSRVLSLWKEKFREKAKNKLVPRIALLGALLDAKDVLQDKGDAVDDNLLFEDLCVEMPDRPTQGREGCEGALGLHAVDRRGQHAGRDGGNLVRHGVFTFGGTAVEKKKKRCYSPHHTRDNVVRNGHCRRDRTDENNERIDALDVVLVLNLKVACHIV